MDLWVLSAAIAIGLQSGIATLSEKRSRARGVRCWLAAGFAVVIVANNLDHTRLPIWFLLSGAILVGLAGWRIYSRQRTMGAWGGTLEASVATLALWVVSADALSVITGLVVGVLLAVAMSPTWLIHRRWVHEWETMTLGAIGLQDIAHTVVGRFPTAHFDWLWLVPWLVWGDVIATSGGAIPLLARPPAPPQQPPGSSD